MLAVFADFRTALESISRKLLIIKYVKWDFMIMWWIALNSLVYATDYKMLDERTLRQLYFAAKTRIK